MNTVRSANKKTIQNKTRSQHGSMIAEGAGISVVCTTLAIGLIFLIINVGVAAYYKGQVSFLSQQAANFAASLPNNSDLSGPTQELIQQLASQSGLHGNHTSEVEALTVDGQSAVKVTMRSAGLPLVGNMFGLINTASSAIALRPSNSGKPDGYLLLSYNGQSGGGRIFLPITTIARSQNPPRAGQPLPVQVTPPGFNVNTAFEPTVWATRGSLTMVGPGIPTGVGGTNYFNVMQ